MKAIVTFALLAFFANTGEAATAWCDNSRQSIDLPDIIGGRTPGGPGIDQSAYEEAADQRVTFNINVTGLGDSTASFYLITFADGPEEYDWALEYLHNPADTVIVHAPVPPRRHFAECRRLCVAFGKRTRGRRFAGVRGLRVCSFFLHPQALDAKVKPIPLMQAEGLKVSSPS